MSARVIFVLLAAVASSSCATSAVSVVEATPATIEIECRGPLIADCPAAQDVADTAQRHCQKFQRNAAQIDRTEYRSGARRMTYRCVNP